MKQTIFKAIIIIIYTSIAFFSITISVHAKNSESRALNSQERLSIAHSFLKKMKSGFSYADTHLLSGVDPNDPNADNILEDGELLLFQPLLPNLLKLDGLIMAEYHDKDIFVSLRDFASLLRLSISVTVNDKEKKASGWYIEKDKHFFFNAETLEAKTDLGTFKANPNTFTKDGDIFVSINDLEDWTNIEFQAIISTQQLKIASEESLPIENYYNRRKLNFQKRQIPKPILPPIENDAPKAFEIPAVDVITNSGYRKRGTQEEGISTHTATVRTVGDFAHGTLTTQSRLNNKDQLVAVTANYKQESVEPDLLGPLKAKRYEIGDVVSTRFDLGGSSSQTLGARITNTDPLRSFSSPTTAISGQAFPKWDVELYRDDTLISFQEVDEDGFYLFENVDLFGSDNNFKLVFYGPQGEQQEETIYIPIDRNRLANQGGIYDVSLTVDDMHTFNRSNFEDEDKGALNLIAHYEHPLFDASALSVQFRTNEHESERNYVVGTGISTTLMETLINADAAVDDEGEAAARLVARKTLGKHDISDNLTWTSSNFDTEGDGDTNDIGSIKNTIRATGPAPLPLGKSPRYNVSASYSENTAGYSTIQASTSFSTNIKRVSLNEQLSFQSSDSSPDDRLNSLTNLSTTYGRNRFRLLTDYQIDPNSDLNRVFASYQRYFSRELDFTLEAERQYNQKINEFSAKLDWQAGFIRLSPQISYNSNKDFQALLNTRFGLLKEPHRDKLEFFDHNISNNGMLSAFVFLDANGDGQYNDGEEKLEGVAVKSIQNGGRAVTDENGIALFTRMQELRLTDVQIDPSSLQDPTWVSGFDGVSVLPRKGHVATVEFPVHISGEIDGTVFAREPLEVATDTGFKTEQTSTPLRNITINLYNDKGQIEQTVTTDSTGFYYFSAVPPGRYLLLVSEKSAQFSNFSRMAPQSVEIGYDGTVIYGKNIIVERGKEDIPSEVKVDLDDYKARHPHIDFEDGNYEIVLNLGEYNSRLLMSVVNYKLKTRYAPILIGGTPMVPPPESYADIKTGKHTLRYGLRNISIDDAYNRCKALVVRDVSCKVEIFPAYMKQAKNEIIETALSTTQSP
ncbi:MAG: carboxypeptidase regulatory-like domain-containing protein [Alphaproteobacteria bacterium]|nr:carboxypeptidase regulatory-like domain-containing protein [Alphaproteobacteria bacterium]